MPLQGSYHAQFVRRRNARVDLDPFYLTLEFDIAHRLQFRASNAAAGLEQTQFTGHRLRGQRVVAGDHRHLDTCQLACLNGSLRFRPGRVNHPD